MYAAYKLVNGVKYWLADEDGNVVLHKVMHAVLSPEGKRVIQENAYYCKVYPILYNFDKLVAAEIDYVV